MKPSRLAVLLIGILCLVACGPVVIIDETGNAPVTVNGAILTLHQEIVIPPDRARVFFQDGRIVGSINEYKPHCQLTVRALKETPQTIHPDTFTVMSVTGDVQKVVRVETIFLAATDEFILADGNGGDNGESDETLVLNMGLRSERQPDVTYLVCGGAFDIPALARQPTLQDIRTAIGSIASFEPAVIPRN